jgi:hypothetical protein
MGHRSNQRSKERKKTRPEIIFETIRTAAEDPQKGTWKLKKSTMPNNIYIGNIHDAVAAERNRLLKKYGHAEEQTSSSAKKTFVVRNISRRHSFAICTSGPKDRRSFKTLNRQASWSVGETWIYDYALFSICLPKKTPKRTVARRNSQVFLGQNPLMNEVLLKAQQHQRNAHHIGK